MCSATSLLYISAGLVKSDLGGGHRTQAFDGFNQNISRVVDLFIRSHRTDTHTKAAANCFARQSHRGKNVAGFERSRGARGAGRYRHAFEIERDQKALSVESINAQIQNIRQAFCVSVDLSSRDAARDVSLEPIAEAFHSSGAIRQRDTRTLGCFSETDDSRDILRSRTPVPFVMPPVEQLA